MTTDKSVCANATNKGLSPIAAYRSVCTCPVRRRTRPGSIGSYEPGVLCERELASAAAPEGSATAVGSKLRAAGGCRCETQAGRGPKMGQYFSSWNSLTR